MYQLFVNVDQAGNIIESYTGKNIIAEEPYHYFFLVDKEVVENIDQYKVDLVGMIPKLVLQE